MSVIKVNTIQNASGTTGITFAANGQMSLANTPLQLTGGQIAFPATQIASGDANTLDDYEEGTWTPTDGSGAGLTFTSAGGKYTKVGRLVTVECYIDWPVTSSSATTVINGLPFSASGIGSVNVDGGGCLQSSSSVVQIFIVSNAVRLYNQPSAFTRTTNVNMSGTSLYFSISYSTT